MARQTQRQPKDEIHGERIPRPRFGPDSDSAVPTGNPADPRGDKVASKDDLKQAEGSPTSATSKAAQNESDKLGKGYREGDKGTIGQRLGGRFRKINLRSRRSIATIAITGLVGGGGIFGFGILQGPFQFVHFAQLLQQFHLRPNEDFGDGRTSRVLLYGLAGKGAERGRLGIIGNRVADAWETRLVDKTGIRPLYDSKTGTFAGWEVMDEGKAKSFIDEYEDSGGKKKTVGEAGEQGVRGSGKANDQAGKSSRFLDYRGDRLGAQRGTLKSASKATGTFRISSAVGFRLTAKRGGITLHPIKRIVNKAANKVAAAKAEREKAAEGDRDGTLSGDGKTKQANETLEDSKNPSEGTTPDEHRSALAKAAGPLVIIGLVCGAQDLGDSAEDAKYANNIMPMIRMGGRVITMGNQAMSGDDIGLDELGAYHEALYDKETKTSWTQARSIQAELGQKKTGPKPPIESRLGNAADRPDVFVGIDAILNFGISIPGPDIKPGTLCGAIDLISKIPGVEQLSELSQGAINIALGPLGTSTEELMGGLIAMINGESVDTLASGAEFGNLANTGAFLAANDQAVSMGGVGLNDEEVAQLKADQAQQDEVDKKSMSLYARYINPYARESLASQIIDKAPASSTGFANTISTIPTSIFSTLSKTFANLMPSASAEGTYDYGVDRYGYSLDDQNDGNFEDPYENALIVEENLDEGLNLNDKYGICFGMKVHADEDGTITLESTEQTVNVLLLEKDDEYKVCREGGEPGDEELFKRYRFYLADAQTILSLACFEGDAEACVQVGIGSAQTGTSDDGGDDPGDGSISGSAQELAKAIIDSGKITGDSGYIGQIDAIAKGNNDCHVNIHILKMLAGLAKDNHSVVISSLNRFCTGVLTESGTGSYHYADGGGHAVDITSFDGQPATGSEQASADYLDAALPYLPDQGVGVGQFQASCGFSYDFPSGVSNFEDACNHVHIQVPKD